MISLVEEGTFGVEKEIHGGAAHLRITGELDMSTSPVLERWIETAEGGANTAVVLDLEHVTFMDSSGLHAFLRAAERADLRGGGFSMVKAPAAVRRVLEVTGMGHLLSRSG